MICGTSSKASEASNTFFQPAPPLFGMRKEFFHTSSLGVIHSLRGGDTDGDQDEKINEDHKGNVISAFSDEDNNEFEQGISEDNIIEEHQPEEELTTYDDEKDLYNETLTSNVNYTDMMVHSAHSNETSSFSALLPKHFYTTIFNHRNTIYGKGNFYTKRERLENLLRKWENDDMKQIQKMCDEKREEGDDENHNSNLKEIEQLRSIKNLVYERAWKYIEDIRQAEEKALERGKLGSITHPKKFLHYIAPKIPAVKISPEISLRIKAATDIDVSAAVCALGAIATLTEYYSCVMRDLETMLHEQKRKEDLVDFLKHSDELGVYKDIVTDRRFEQLVECIQCGVDMEDLKDHPLLSFNAIALSCEVTPVKEGIVDSFDASRIIWSMMIFLSHHDIGEIGGETCSHFMQGLQRYTNAILIQRCRGLLSGKNSVSFSSASEDEMFLDELKSLLRDTTISLWASERTSNFVQYHNSNLVQTCCLILMQHIEEAWLLRRKKKDEESKVDDIVERLAESEEMNTERPETEDDQSDLKKSTIGTESKVPLQDILTDPHRSETSFLHFLSMRDLMVTLKAMINIDGDHIILDFLTKAGSLWIETDLHSIRQSLKTTKSTAVELVNAEAVLAPNMHSIDAEGSNEQEQDFDHSELSMSLNDLSSFVWAVGQRNDEESASHYLQLSMQLFLLFFGQEKLDVLDNDTILKILEGSSQYSKYLLQNGSTNSVAWEFYSNITTLVLDRFTELKDTQQDFTTIDTSQLISMISSLHAINSTHPLSPHDFEHKLNLNYLVTRVMSKVMEDTELFSLDELSRVSCLLTQSYQKETIPLSLCHFLGRISAKLHFELNKWLESYACNSLTYETSQPFFPYSLDSICNLFVGLVELGLHPLEWCTVLSSVFQKINPKINPDDIVRLLHASAEMKIIDDDNEPLKSLHLNSLVQSLLGLQKDGTDEPWSSSIESFVMYVWSLTIHCVKNSEMHINLPDELLDGIHSLSPSLKVKLVSDSKKFAFILYFAFILHFATKSPNIH